MSLSHHQPVTAATRITAVMTKPCLMLKLQARVADARCPSRRWQPGETCGAAYTTHAHNNTAGNNRVQGGGSMRAGVNSALLLRSSLPPLLEHVYATCHHHCHHHEH